MRVPEENLQFVALAPDAPLYCIRTGRPLAGSFYIHDVPRVPVRYGVLYSHRLDAEAHKALDAQVREYYHHVMAVPKPAAPKRKAAKKEKPNGSER